jgi:hypothetical protein
MTTQGPPDTAPLSVPYLLAHAMLLHIRHRIAAARRQGSILTVPSWRLAPRLRLSRRGPAARRGAAVRHNCAARFRTTAELCLQTIQGTMLVPSLPLHVVGDGGSGEVGEVQSCLCLIKTFWLVEMIPRQVSRPFGARWLAP